MDGSVGRVPSHAEVDGVLPLSEGGRHLGARATEGVLESVRGRTRKPSTCAGRSSRGSAALRRAFGLAVQGAEGDRVVVGAD